MDANSTPDPVNQPLETGILGLNDNPELAAALSENDTLRNQLLDYQIEREQTQFRLSMYRDQYRVVIRVLYAIVGILLVLMLTTPFFRISESIVAVVKDSLLLIIGAFSSSIAKFFGGEDGGRRLSSTEPIRRPKKPKDEAQTQTQLVNQTDTESS